MKKTKKQCNPDLYTDEEGILTGKGHFVFGNDDLGKKVGKSAKGKIVFSNHPTEPENRSC